MAKRTGTEGTRPLGLSKNEKLILGYPVWDDGTFEPEEMELKSASVNGPRYRLRSSAFETVGSCAENFKEATLMDRFNKRLPNDRTFYTQCIRPMPWRKARLNGLAKPEPNAALTRPI